MQYRLDHIETFVTIVESKSYSKAAKKLHKVRSALTYDIQSLESAIGVELFDRSAYRTALTKEGERFFGEAKKLLLNAQQVWDFTRQLSSQWEPRIRIIIDGVIPNEPVLAAIQHLLQQEIPTQIDLRMSFLEGVVEKYNRLDADIMVVSDGVPFGSDFDCIELPPIECELVAQATHDIFSHDKITLEVLQQYSEIQVQGVSTSFKHQIGGKKLLAVSDFCCKKQSLLMGMGFGWMPSRMIEKEKEGGQLKQIAYDRGATYQFHLILAVNKGRLLGPAGELLKRYLIDEFQSYKHQSE